VSPRFHARHSALARSYLYQIARRRTAFGKPFVWWVKDDLHVAAMAEAGEALAGFGDYRAFTDDDPDEKSTRVLVEELVVEERGGLVLIRVTGSHFLWKMVRRIVGVLVEVGTGRSSATEIAALTRPGALPEALLPARFTAPASGLFLERVFYDGDARPRPLEPAILRLG
jgi:tRNA pseudouridine38-40 synthase